MTGELAVWHSEKYRVLVTPNFDDVPVPVEVLKIDANRDYNIIDEEGYYGEVNSFEQYVEIVKTLTKKILDELIPKLRTTSLFPELEIID